MQNKVSNGLFRLFARTDPDVKPHWRDGGLANGKEIRNGNDRLPVFRVPRDDAKRFARWLGGVLPAAADLDLAAQSLNSKSTRGAVGLWQTGPKPVDRTDCNDVTSAGIRDLSGNGREWTSDVLTVNGKELAVLRGRSYAAEGPREPITPETTPTQYPDHPSPFTTFRVLIELPA
jgi:formylglycine-generating enzyme required for sulfatase activity